MVFFFDKSTDRNIDTLISNFFLKFILKSLSREQHYFFLIDSIIDNFDFLFWNA